MDPTGLLDRPKEPLLQVLDRTRSRLKGTRINRHNVLQMVRRRAKGAGLPPSDTPLGTAFFLLSIMLALLFWAPVICMVMGLPWAPGAALICARIARRKQWDVRRYAIAGAIYSALLFWPWVYLTLHMSGRSVRPWVSRADEKCTTGVLMLSINVLTN